MWVQCYCCKYSFDNENNVQACGYIHLNGKKTADICPACTNQSKAEEKEK